MELMITIINSILAKALNHHQFKEFLFEMESEYADLLFRNKVRWLPRGNVLKRFASLFPEIKAFLIEKGVFSVSRTNRRSVDPKLSFHGRRYVSSKSA
ncbi:general transcription factor II-I repeat domain-containing protein 2A [Trichonephila clavipes]|nr:general transcription factor II-I repeat domain-containing protein 2A [Trichonephila clavipes]